MTFPNVPLDVRVELKYDGIWNTITPDVRGAEAIGNRHGRPDEASAPTPATCNLTLSNRLGKYSPRNPMSPLYGKIGRNTPLRVRVGAKDASMRLSGDVGAYASTPDTAALDVVGAIDVRIDIEPDSWRPTQHKVLASKYLTTGEQRSWGFRLRTDGTLEFGWGTDGTGTTIVTRTSTAAVPSTTTRLAVRAALATNNGAAGNTITFYTAPTLAGPYTQLGSAIVTAGVTSIFSGTAQVLVGARDGDGGGAVFTADSTPFAGLVNSFEMRNGIGGTVVTNPDFTAQDMGVTSFADSTAKTWTLRGSALIQDLSSRFVGEVSEWPPRWDTSGRDVRTQIVASGIRRRIGQGANALRSALYRGITSGAITRPVAYWPCEDGQNATTFASAFGQPPMTILGGAAVRPAAFSGAVASAPIPTISTGGRLDGPVPPYPASNQLRGLAFINVPTGGTGVETTVIRMQTTGGSTESWFLSIKADGALHLVVFANGGANVLDVTSAFALNGQTGMIWIWLQQVGADISWQFGFAQVGGSVLAPFGTLVGHSFGAAMTMIIGQNFDLNGVSVGHVMVLNTSEFWSIIPFINAWANETTVARMARLAGEEGVPLTSRAGPTGSEMLGPQRPTEFLGLLDEGAAADMGILAERRDALSLHYRSRSDLYNQTPVLALTYTSGHLAPPVEPTDDDQAIHNDVTVTRTNGSSFRAVLETGALSVLPAPAGVGRYNTSLTVTVASDTQLPDQAGWRRRLGTLDQTRYPVLRINLAHNPELIPAVKRLQLGDRITVANPPVWLAPEPIDVIVQGWSERLTNYGWTIQFNTSPGAGYQTVRLDDTALGKIDTDTSVLTVAATSTATTLVVADAPGPGWTTDPAQMPIPITVAGEAMSVTAVSAEGLSNTGFESGVAPWGVTGGTRTQSSVQKHAGSFAARIVPDGVSTQGNIFSENLPIVPNKPITASAWFWFTNAVTANANIVLTFLDANQVFVSSSLGTAASVAAATWTQLTQTVTPPPTARYVQVVPRLGGTPAAAQIWYVDDVSLIGGPQTVTATRSVNGVVKAQAAGAAVHLTRPATIAL